MSKKLTTISPLKRPSTRSISTPKSTIQDDKYTFQSDDEDHNTKPTLLRKTNTSVSSKRSRGRPIKPSKSEDNPTHSSSSPSSSETDEKKRPVTRRGSRLGSQTNTPVSQIREKIKINSTPPILITPKKRGRKPKMLSTTGSLATPSDDQQKHETENLLPASSSKHQQINANDKDLMQFGSPEQDDFSDDSVDFVWKGSSKMSIEILKRRIPKDESREHYSSTNTIQSDPTAQRKRAIIPRLTNFDALSGQPIESSTPKTNDISAKKSNSIITLNNAFQNDFDYSYNDTGTKMSTTTNNMDDKPRPRVYAVKSTTMKSRPQQQQQQQQQQQSDIKRPKWMDDQQGGGDDGDDEHLPTAADEPNDYDYVPKGQYAQRRPNYRGRATFPGRRGTGMRGRPPGSRRHWTNDDDDDDYDQYEEVNSRYGPRKQMPYRPSRPLYDTADDDDYDKNRRISLTQAYRRPNDNRQSMGARRIGINNGNHPAYKDDDYYHQQQQQQHHHHHQQQSRSSTTTTTNRLPTTNAASINAGNTFVAKINDAQLSEVANQSQFFFVNVPQQDQKNQQVLSVLASEQQQVLPVAVVQQAKVETPSSVTTNNSAAAQNQTLAFTVKLPVDTPKQKKILPKPSTNNPTTNNSTTNKPFAWSRPPGRIQLNNDEQSTGKGLTITPINTDLDTMEAAHVLATAADVTMAADARRKALQHDDDMNMMVDETPSNIVNEETVQCEDDGQKHQTQQLGTITANIIDEHGNEHTVILSTEEAQQLLGSQGAIIVDSDGQAISIQQPQPQTFLSPFALDQAQLQALLTQAGIDPNTPLTIEQIDPNQQQQMATLCTSPGGTQYTVLTQAPAQQQQQFILQTAPISEPLPPPPPPQPIAPKEDLSSPPKRRAFAVKSTMSAAEPYDDMNTNDRPRRKIFATKSTVSPID